MWSRGGRQRLPASSRQERQIAATSVVLFASAAYTNLSPGFPPSSLNRVQGTRRVVVLGLREAMGYAMTCRRRLCGHGEAPVKAVQCLVAGGKLVRKQ
jgi:hypothetical protein